VSRRFVVATREQLAQMMSRDLGRLSLCAVMIDGIHVDQHLGTWASGSTNREKSTSSVCTRGATEYSTVCVALLTDLVARGMHVVHLLLGLG
jgi:hypothetical protein